MNLEELYTEIEVFSKETHGSSNFYAEEIFVMGQDISEFAPLKYLCKKMDLLGSADDLLRKGFVFDSYELFSELKFKEWFERQFARKLTRKISKGVSIIHKPNNKLIFDAIEGVNNSYQTLRSSQILLNGKNLPVQLGEWYAKCIFGLKQIKSTSQRGFDFYLDDKRVEVMVHWSDQSSPKGVKVKKSLIELSDYLIVIYIARNFMIRELCFLDAEFVLRRFSGKGHTIFLKDPDIQNYFFSKASKHQNKVINSTALLKYSSPTFAIKIAESFQNVPKDE